MNQIFNDSDLLLDKFLLLYDNCPNDDTAESKNITPSQLEFAAICCEINNTVVLITKIWEKWFKENNLSKYFHEVWFETLYLDRFIRKKLNKIANNVNPKENLILNFKDSVFWEYHRIILNISSAFDKIANAFLFCNSPIISDEEKK